MICAAQSWRTLLYGEKPNPLFQVDKFGNSVVPTVSREVALMEIIKDSLNKLNEEELKEVFRLVLLLGGGKISFVNTLEEN